MATKTQGQAAKAEAPTSPDLSKLLGVDTVADVDPSETLRSNRGRQVGKDIVALRTILQDAAEKGILKAFQGVTTVEKKNSLTQKVRTAGKGAAKDGSDIKVSTSYSPDKGMLYWGDKATFEKHMGRSKTDTEK